MPTWVRETIKRAPPRITTFWIVGFTNVCTVPAKIALPKHAFSYLMEHTICGKLFFKSWCTRECWQSHGPLSHYCIFCAINFTGELSKWDASQQISTVLITVFSFWMEKYYAGSCCTFWDAWFRVKTDMREDSALPEHCVLSVLGLFFICGTARDFLFHMRDLRGSTVGRVTVARDNTHSRMFWLAQQL